MLRGKTTNAMDQLILSLQQTTTAQRAMTRALLVQAEAVQSLADSCNALAQAVGQMVVLDQSEPEDDGSKYVTLMNGQRIKVS